MEPMPDKIRWTIEDAIDSILMQLGYAYADWMPHDVQERIDNLNAALAWLRQQEEAQPRQSEE